MSLSRDEPFYVGYQPAAPASIASVVGVVAAGLVGAALTAGAVLALTQDRADPGAFEFGHPRTVRGILTEHPYPSVAVPAGGPDSLVRYLLVAEGKHGAQDLAAGYDGRWVQVRGTRIARPEREMLEVVAEGITPSDPPPQLPVTPGLRHLGRRTLQGEVVDSKCWLGVMKPATGNIHRGCAARCLSGGIPPLLMIHLADGRVQHVLLTAANGEPASDQYAGKVGRPVRVTGELYEEGDLRILRVEMLTEH
ncbi:MAG: hypothetical protein E4H38_06730 [Gemmatimonadales bacterium]|nr:MAG: hypothetical protein E4H38_06730 [Gemmatimonadales bacterium]